MLKSGKLKELALAAADLHARLVDRWITLCQKGLTRKAKVLEVKIRVVEELTRTLIETAQAAEKAEARRKRETHPQVGPGPKGVNVDRPLVVAWRLG